MLLCFFFLSTTFRWGRDDEILENYRKLYAHLIKDIVSREDPLRPYLTSSPTNGIRSDEEHFVSISISPSSELYGDSKQTHF